MQNDQLSPEKSDGPTHSREAQWKEGDLLTFVRVRFPGNTKSFPFLTGQRKFAYGQKVVAMSDRGMDVGYINSFPYQAPFSKSMLPILTISKEAGQEDLDKQQELYRSQKQAEACCNDWVAKLGLEMTITHVESVQYGRKMVFYFNAPARVDFRELIKKLVADLRLRVELRQISVRDRTAAIGSIGPCGLMTCCSSFLQQYGNVGIRMAKNQNLSLIPGKLNGVCGQLKCCIKYEDEVYKEKRQNLPKVGRLIQTANGDRGKVSQVYLLKDVFDMITDRGQLRRYTKEQYEGEPYPEGEKFPERFEHVSVETKNIIGRAEPSPGPDEPPRRDILNDTDNDTPKDGEEEREDKQPPPREEDLNEAELEEDMQALRKAQSLSLEEQERASQQNEGGHGQHQTRGNHRFNKGPRRPGSKGGHHHHKRPFNKGSRNKPYKRRQG